MQGVEEVNTYGVPVPVRLAVDILVGAYTESNPVVSLVYLWAAGQKEAPENVVENAKQWLHRRQILNEEAARLLSILDERWPVPTANPQKALTFPPYWDAEWHMILRHGPWASALGNAIEDAKSFLEQHVS